MPHTKTKEKHTDHDNMSNYIIYDDGSDDVMCVLNEDTYDRTDGEFNGFNNFDKNYVFLNEDLDYSSDEDRPNK